MEHQHTPYRVLIVDDMPAVRDALRWALESEADLLVVGEASEGFEALTRAAALLPDVVLVDVALPGLDGYAVTRALKITAHPPVVVLLTVYGNETARRRGVNAGADGFAEKSASWTVLLTELRRALADRRPERPS
jgi:DNA-binding NarL/FixJ family response regulator